MAVVIALVFLGEPLVAGLVVGAVLVVGGGVLLAERARPAGSRSAIGLVLALGCAMAVRRARHDHPLAVARHGRAAGPGCRAATLAAVR